MTMAFIQGPSGLGPAVPGCAAGDVRVDETQWGYIVRSAEREAGAAWLARRLAVLVAVAACVSILLLWLTPGVASPLGRIGATGLLTGFAGIAVWLAGRGFLPETHVDLRAGEVREVLRDMGGRTRPIARTAFGDIGGVHIDRRGRGKLVLRWRNTCRTLTVATGEEDALMALRDRIGRDLLKRPR